MQFLYLDIETIPCQDDETKSELVANAKPPANYKNEDTIAKWRSENEAKIIAETSFDGGLGHICQICALADHGEFSLALGENVDAERLLLSRFADWLPVTVSPPIIVGHNINAFDIRFIWQRAIVLGVRLPAWFPRDPKPWGMETFDTMLAWAGTRGHISLYNLAKRLGLAGKSGMDGSMVAQAWLDGKHEAIAKYCMDDVLIVRAIHKKMLEAGL